MIHLRVEFDIELGLYRRDDTAFKADDFLRECLACVVYNHQRLLVPYCCISAASAFPTALLDQPCSWYLDQGFLDSAFGLARNDR